VVGNETSDPAVWLDRLAAIYESVTITYTHFYGTRDILNLVIIIVLDY